jgi:hypothetical protein
MSFMTLDAALATEDYANGNYFKLVLADGSVSQSMGLDGTASPAPGVTKEAMGTGLHFYRNGGWSATPYNASSTIRVYMSEAGTVAAYPANVLVTVTFRLVRA